MNDSATHVSDQLLDETATQHTRSRYGTAAPVYDLMEWPVERGLYRAWRKDLWAGIEGPRC